MNSNQLNHWINKKITNLPHISDWSITEHFDPKNFSQKQLSDGTPVPIFDGFKNTINRDWNVSIAFPVTKDVPTHVHKYLEIGYIFQGGCQQTIQNRSFHMQKGDIVLFDINEPHSYKLDNTKTVIINIVITNNFFNSEFLSTFEGADLFSYYVSSIISHQNIHNQFVLFETHDSHQITKLMENILSEYIENKNESNQIIENYLHILFLMMKRKFRTIKSFNNINQKSGLSIVYPFMSWLESNYRTATLHSFSASIGYHPDYVGRLIKYSTGQNFSDWVKVIRMKTAANLLINNKQSITEIAHEIGYSNMTSFYQTFRETYSLTPLQYRNDLKTGVEYKNI